MASMEGEWDDPLQMHHPLLWKPVSGDHGARGLFDTRAHAWSAQRWATTYRRWLMAAVTLGVLAILTRGRR